MKILLITHLLPYPPRGGCSLRNFNLIKECSKHHDIHLMTFYRKAHIRSNKGLEDSIRGMKQYCKELQVFEIPSDHSRLRYYSSLFMNLFSSQPYSAGLYKSSALEAAVRAQLAEEDFDIVEIGEIGLLNYADLAPGIPKVLVHHNIESQLLYRRSKAAGNFLSRHYLSVQAFKTALFEKKAGETIDFHTTCSEIDRLVLKKISPKANATVVPNGVDTEFFKSTEEPVEANSLVFVGGLDWLPNREAMKFFKDDIWPLLKKEIPDIKISVIGGNPPPELVAFSKQEPAFNVTGFVDDIRSHISRAAIYVVPIRVGGGTRLKILDALSMSKAIVSCTIGCEGIDVTDGKDIVIADTAEDFAARVIELLKDEKKRKALESNARQTAVSKYDWSKIAPILENIYATPGKTGGTK